MENTYMKPTLEQEAVIKAFAECKMLKVNATAGSGKTHTLALLANANPAESLYVAFNKAIADEATTKFPSYVHCRTGHSLAYAKYGKELRHKLNRPRGGYVNVAGTSSEIAKYYNIQPIKCPSHIEGGKDVSETAIASLIRDTVRRYEQSGDMGILIKHVPAYEVMDIIKSREWLDKDSLMYTILTNAHRLWADRTNVHSNVLATHDTYFKLYQLSKPKIGFDIIYLDEAQDTSDVMLDIILNQTHAKICIVGDTYQSIYAWRNAVNAMEKIDCPTRYLTQSFRFGEAVAKVATDILQSEVKVRGYDQIQSSIGTVDKDKPYTMLFRTNSALLEHAIEFVIAGKSVSCEVDTRDFKKFLDSSLSLYKGDMGGVKHDSVVPYSSWEEMNNAAEDEAELRRMVKIVNTGKAGFYLSKIDSLKKKDNADVILTTAHKSKGREWDQVVMANDFPEADEDGTLPEQERNLMYVAATRAVKHLNPNKTYYELIKGDSNETE